MTDRFESNQVIGVVADSVSELDQAAHYGLASVEIRVDLLLSAGHTIDDVLQLVANAASKGFGVLATVRHPSHGGKYQEPETQRVALYREILNAGADLIDVEWDSEAAPLLQDVHHRLVLSYHNFSAMIASANLSELTSSLEAREPFAIKIVPTAQQLSDATLLLEWVAQSASGNSATAVRRIGFVMGEQGACSRILSPCFGGALTYASFGEAVAPGQISLDQLINEYRVPGLDQETRVTAVVDIAHSSDPISTTDIATHHVRHLNQEYARDNVNRVAINLSFASLEDVEAQAVAMRIDEIVEARPDAETP